MLLLTKGMMATVASKGVRWCCMCQRRPVLMHGSSTKHASCSLLLVLLAPARSSPCLLLPKDSWWWLLVLSEGAGSQATVCGVRSSTLGVMVLLC